MMGANTNPRMSKAVGTRIKIMGTEEHHLPKNSLTIVFVDMNEIIGIVSVTKHRIHIGTNALEMDVAML